MPDAWSAKDERQYKHIKKSYKQRGVSNDEAEERAARTVNKERREEGRTLAQRRNNSNADLTKKELYAQARRLDVQGRSKMDKAQLKRAVAAAK